MAYSAWLIRPPSEQRPQTAARQRVQPQAADAAKFAALIAGEGNDRAGATGAAAGGHAGEASRTAATDQQRQAAARGAGSVTRQDSAADTPRRGGATAQFQPRVARLPEVRLADDATTLPLRNPVLAGRNPNDLIRAQNFTKARADIAQTRALDGLMQGLSGGTALDAARNMGAARHLRTITAAANNGRGFALTAADFIHTRQNVRTEKGAARRQPQPEESGLGRLSARFESGGEGIAAIGYDRNGGTSYGKYQIASRVGSMKSFLGFLDSEAPDLAQRLRKAGPANTGSRRGGMPDAWRAIAKEQPERFEELQEAFIRESHYKPAMESIVARTGLEADSLSPAMREVIWSTAVQHGPAGAARIFERADDLSGRPEDAAYERRLISNVYKLRAGQFGSSTTQVRQAVRSRFREEQQLALNMLDGGAGTANLA